MRWAIVIGVDEYGSAGMRLSGAVADACRFRAWVTAADGGGVGEANLRLLLARREDDHTARDPREAYATRDSIVAAIDEVVRAAEAEPEPADRLYFYYSGHGITARMANRDESALVTPGFDAGHTSHSLAVRSITEHFETSPFNDQFVFIDACRNVPAGRDIEIGRWPIPRRRDPGTQPVQQFVLYATSPGRTAHEDGWPGEESGAFTRVLLKGLEGEEEAKAWSWERGCYEVRWERLATYVHLCMQQRARRPEHVSPLDWPVQIPQDTGARGVVDRERDISVVSYDSARFEDLKLTVRLEGERATGEADVQVLDAVGEPVKAAVGAAGEPRVFDLPARTYAIRATTTLPPPLSGVATPPVDLYADRDVNVSLRPQATPADAAAATEPVGTPGTGSAGDRAVGTIELTASDPLSLAEICDETGRVVGIAAAGTSSEHKPGFYRVSHVGPEDTALSSFVALAEGERVPVRLEVQPPDTVVAALAAALGGGVDDGYVRPVAGAGRVAWARPSTLAAVCVAAGLEGEAPRNLGRRNPFAAVAGAASGVAVLAVSGTGDVRAVKALHVRVWPVGEEVPARAARIRPSRAGIAVLTRPVPSPRQHWVALGEGDAEPTVVALPVLPGRLATLVAQVDPERIRLYQYHPAVVPGVSGRAADLRSVELLERLLLAGRVDVAEPLATSVLATAAADPFAGLVAGYVLLRLGRHDLLGALASEIVEVAPGLADAYVLRGEHEAQAGRQAAAAQAFTDALNAGIPAFGEGLTRLLEGARAYGLNHPRAALVRHIFQRHARGSMWAAFVPRRTFARGERVISVGDLGIEG